MTVLLPCRHSELDSESRFSKEWIPVFAKIGYNRPQEPVDLLKKESNQLFFCYTKMVCDFQ
jgi:hypothetical protein